MVKRSKHDTLIQEIARHIGRDYVPVCNMEYKYNKDDNNVAGEIDLGVYNYPHVWIFEIKTTDFEKGYNKAKSQLSRIEDHLLNYDDTLIIHKYYAHGYHGRRNYKYNIINIK